MRGEGEHTGCWSSRLPISRTLVVKDDTVDGKRSTLSISDKDE